MEIGEIYSTPLSGRRDSDKEEDEEVHEEEPFMGFKIEKVERMWY